MFFMLGVFAVDDNIFHQRISPALKAVEGIKTLRKVSVGLYPYESMYSFPEHREL
jgi:hypothetical protein